MDLTPYIDTVRRELAVVAEAAGEDAGALAQRLSAPLESALRLSLLDALSAAADEITRDLAPGSVEVRLRGREPSFVVTPPPFGDDDRAAEPAPAEPLVGNDSGTSRINLRLPDQLKARAEEAAAREGLSVNNWLARAVAAALHPGSRDRGPGPRTPPAGRSYTGWVR
jgi:hypothetical protein